MPSHPETNVRGSTVDKISAESPESDQSAGTGGLLLKDIDFVSYDGKPVEEFQWTYHECVSPGTVQALEKIWPGETPAGQATVGDNRSEWGGGEQSVKTELRSAVSNISDYCMTHTKGNPHDSRSRRVRDKTEQSGVTRRKVQGGRTTTMHTRSQGPVPSEEDGASTTGGSTAVKIKNDGQKVIKKEKL
jgi:hypothetical protein